MKKLIWFVLFLNAYLINPLCSSESSTIKIYPFENLSSFIFYPMFPSKSKILSDKINHVIESELKKYGRVDALKLVVKTTDGESFDLSQFEDRSHLIYKINNIVSLDGTAFSIIEASLTLENTIKDKTKKSSFGQIFRKTVF